MSEVVLEAKVRTQIGRISHRLRKEGIVPGIYYSRGEGNINVSTTPSALRPLIYTTDTHLISLKLDNGEVKSCILRDVQYDPLTDKAIHFDLQGVKENEELTVKVPVVLLGTPKGVKDGGTLQHVMRTLRVSCLPKFIPEHIEINVAELGINASVHVRDLKVENVRMLDNEAGTVVAVVPPTVVKEETPGVETATAVVAATAEPEVITKGKKPVEGEVVTKGKKPVEGEVIPKK
jgi:large subunit ribosomal protein L25